MGRRGKKASAEFLEEGLARTDFAGLICRASRFKGEKYSDAKENKKKGVYLHVVKEKEI